MAYTLEEGRRLVVEAGLKLVASGLIARTWGNVSARVSDTEFVITPSGIPYEALTPEDLVVVTIRDCSYDETQGKPSSEKGVHAAAYELHPEVDFVIHTHQVAASVLSILGSDIPVPEAQRPLLGPVVPNAAYGMPSTEKLRKGVYAAISENPKSTALLMRHHGTVCMGKTYEESFEIASALEELAVSLLGDYAASFAASAVVPEDRAIALQDLGTSVRTGTGFELTMKDGSKFDCNLSGVARDGIAPRVSRIHSEIYQRSNVQYIKQDDSDNVVLLSCAGKPEIPYLDDFTQIAGINIKNIPWEESGYRTQAVEIAKALSGRNAVLVKGMGALCTGNTESDTDAVELVLEKEAAASLYAASHPDAKTLSKLDCVLQRTVYVLKYSKLASRK